MPPEEDWRDEFKSMTEPLFSRLLVRLCSIGARTSHGRDLSFDSAALVLFRFDQDVPYRGHRAETSGRNSTLAGAIIPTRIRDTLLTTCGVEGGFGCSPSPSLPEGACLLGRGMMAR